MRSPPIAPQGFDVDVYVVLDDFGKLGRAYRETEEEAADKETIIRNLVEGQYNNPVRIVAFNTAEGWSRDVTEDIALEIRDRADRSGEELSAGLRDFIDNEISRAKRLLLFPHPFEIFRALDIQEAPAVFATLCPGIAP
jgi:hypothetical protein